MLADTAMDTISESKLEESSAVELVRIASIATERAGAAPPSVQEQYFLSIAKYRVVPPPSSSDDPPPCPDTPPDP